MRVLISGSSGLVGSTLSASLRKDGHEVLALVRDQADPSRGRIGWDPRAGILGIEALGRLDAVVHLAGAGIGEGRWTPDRKERIYSSRVKGTALLAEILALLPEKPGAFLCASAVGFYGDRGDEVLDETSQPGSGFLAKVCRDWEEASRRAAEAGIRVVNLRSGLVLSARGGALARMLPAFRWGAGAVWGDGRQWMSWISLGDEVAAIRFALERGSLSGPVNLTSPGPVTNRDFARALGGALGRPVLAKIPAWGVRLLFGEMGKELFLFGQRALPTRLTEAGFVFETPALEEAFRREGVGSGTGTRKS